MLTLKNKRPLGTITLNLNGTTITRSCPFTPNGETRTLNGVDADKLHKGLEVWCAGELIQKALPFLSVEDREWLITGM